MKWIVKMVSTIALSSVGTAPAIAADQAVDADCPIAAEAQSEADAAFEQIYTKEYAWRLKTMAPNEDAPEGANRHLPDVGPQAQAETLTLLAETVKALDALDPATLSEKNQINYAVYKEQVRALLEAQQYREFEKPLSGDTSFWSDIAGWPREVFRTEEDYRRYIDLMREVPRYFDQQIANMRAGLKRGFTPPREVLGGRDKAVAEIAVQADPNKSPFWAPFAEMPDVIPDAQQEKLRQEGAAAIRDAILPAHRELAAFLKNEYIPHARPTLAAFDMPDGKSYYRSKIREYVTLDLSPEEIHQLGLREVEKIRAQMQEVMRETGFEGDLSEFLQFLRTDPQFYPETAQDLLNRAAWVAKSFDGVASQFFGHLPRSRFAIKPVPDDVAPFYTAGRGGPGIYLVNTYNLKSRPYYQMVALTLHESAPGHAFQMPLAAEDKDLPQFRRDTYISAYGEGWALYSEKLGEDMGMYDDPYDRFGMLSYQIWRAARLVVDTGLHTQGWSRERARQFLHDNTALSDHEIHTEVDRYAAWPGQALSYYIGELTFLDAREKAKQALGEKFDIRAWHDAMLKLGSVPLTIVQQRNEQFIAEGGKGPYSDEE